MKKVLVTGGTRGIGRKTAELFHEKGYKVFVTYVKSDDEAEKLRCSGIEAVKADVSDREQVAALHEKVGDIDILVNNAGIAYYGMLCDMDKNKWNRLFEVNVTGVFNCVQEFSPHMVHEKHGSIVNMASVWGVTGGSCEVAYSATKAAVIGFTKALAKELGPSGITVNCVAPGVIATDMIANLSEEDIGELKEETPLCRIGEPSDIAQAVLYLSEAKFVTGEVLNINGGFVI